MTSPIFFKIKWQVLLFSFFLSFTLGAQVLDSTLLKGLTVYQFQSKILGEKRRISVQLPAAMDRFSAYPVLYVLDGEAQTGLVAAQVQYLSESYKIIPNLIVVGIYNTDRMRDLTPTHTDLGPDGKLDTSANAPFKHSGGGERFLQFLQEEVKPFIESRFRVAPYSILTGHSLGGLMAIYCLIHHAQYYNAYIAISPSLQWDERSLLKEIASHHFDPAVGHKLFYSDANEDPAFHQNQLLLDSILKKQVAVSFKRNFYPEESHISEPVKGFYDGIRFIYPSWHLPYNNSGFRKTMTASIIMDQYKKLSGEYGYTVLPLHDEIIQICRFFQNDPTRIKDAATLLEWNAGNYPSSVQSLEILGDTYIKMGEKQRAKAIYEKAFALDQKETLRKKLAGFSNE